MLNLLTNQFDRLFVISFVGNIPSKGRCWLCKCVCGKYKIVSTACLRAGLVRSCGCLYRLPKKHGFAHTKLYKQYYGIWQRCYYKAHKDNRYYSAKGIEMCKEWKGNFLNFRAWAMASGWQHGLVVDRIDPNKNYSPENCQLMTPSAHSLKTHKDNGHRVKQFS